MKVAGSKAFKTLYNYRRMHISSLSIASILLTFSLVFTSTAQANSGLSKSFGEKTLPEVKVKDLQGNLVDISSFAKDGKVTVINFWATWCTPCKKELGNITDLYEDWQEQYGMELVAVSIDDSRNVAKVKTYVRGQNWDYTILLDTNQELKRALGFQTIPYTIVVDKEGKIAHVHSGYVEGDEYILEEKIAELAK